MNKLNPKNYIWEWERNCFPYYFYLFSWVWLFDKYSSPAIYTVMLSERRITNTYLDYQSLQCSARGIISNLKNDPNYFKDWRQHTFKTGRDLHKFCDQLNKVNWHNISDQELLKIFKLAVEVYSHHTASVVTIRSFNRIAQEILQKKFDLTIIPILLATNKKSFFTNEHEDLLRLADKARRSGVKSSATRKLLKKHTEKYFYLPRGYHLEKSFTSQDFKKRLQAIIKSGETLRQSQAKTVKAAEERQQLIKKLALTPTIKKIIEFGSVCTYFKDFIRGNLNRLHYYNTLIFKEIARRTGNDWPTIAGLLPPEIEKVLINKQKIAKDETLVLYSDKTGIHKLVGLGAKRIIKKFERHFLAAASREIKGTPANQGKVSGRVLVIRNASEVGNKKDYILVTTMTTPDLMPAIKKSLAIITDEGGLTCHAAIVARELDKPCIVGTKIATKVLRSGDLVEVDADKGLIKIIKKKK